MSVQLLDLSFLFSLRFSHSPLIDEEDEEEEAKEPMLNEAFGKMYYITHSLISLVQLVCSLPTSDPPNTTSSCCLNHEAKLKNVHTIII